MASARRALLKKSNSPDTSRSRWKDVVAGVEFEKRIERERMERTRSLLQSINQSAASAVLPSAELSEKERAVIVCQKYVRAKLARKEFASRLYQRFMEDEQAREEKQRQQMEEAEVLLALRRMETEAEDASSVSTNRQRRRADAATRIQRAWRRYHGYEYSETYDWQQLRANPFSPVMPVATVSAFNSPDHQPEHRQASGDSGDDDDNEGEATLDLSAKAAAAAAAVVASGASIHLQYADEDWDLTPGTETAAAALQIAEIEAQLMSVQEIGQMIDGHLPGILGAARADASDADDIDDDADDGRNSDEYGYEDGDDDMEPSDSGGGRDDDDDEEPLRYRPRSFEQKSLSMADIRRTSFDKGGGDGGMATAAVASRGEVSAAIALSPHHQSAGDLYQICYDSELSRRGKLGSLGQSTSSGCSAASSAGRRSPDGSSGHPTPQHEVADQERCGADERLDRAKLYLDLPASERGELAVAGSHRAAATASVAAGASSTAVPADGEFESEVLGSVWYQRSLEADQLRQLSGTQLACIAEEFRRLVNISSNELVRQLEIRDDSVHTRDERNAKEAEWARQYQEKMDENKKELLQFARAASEPKGPTRQRFGFLSRKSK